MTMKTIWLIILIASSAALLITLLKSRFSRISLKKVIVHWILAATLLFLLNYFEFTEQVAVPINPLTIGTTAVLGIPGLGLLIGAQYLLL